MGYSNNFKAAHVLLIGLYAVLMLAQSRLVMHYAKAWGLVFESPTHGKLPLVAIQLIEAGSGKVVASRLTDYDGRFTFLPDPGVYIVKATKSGYVQDETKPVQISKKSSLYCSRRTWELFVRSKPVYRDW